MCSLDKKAKHFISYIGQKHISGEANGTERNERKKWDTKGRRGRGMRAKKSEGGKVWGTKE